jgi:uncharacterized protein YkwD
VDVELLEQPLPNLSIGATTEEYAFGHDHASSPTLGKIGHNVLDEKTLCGRAADPEVSLQVRRIFPP